MLNAESLRMMGRVIDTVAETRVVYKDDNVVGIDEAGLQAITGVLSGLLNPDEEHAEPATIELFLTITIELLHELPKPSTGEVLLAMLKQRVGARGGG